MLRGAQRSGAPGRGGSPRAAPRAPRSNLAACGGSSAGARRESCAGARWPLPERRRRGARRRPGPPGGGAAGGGGRRGPGLVRGAGGAERRVSAPARGAASPPAEAARSEARSYPQLPAGLPRPGGAGGRTPRQRRGGREAGGPLEPLRPCPPPAPPLAAFPRPPLSRPARPRLRGSDRGWESLSLPAPGRENLR